MTYYGAEKVGSKGAGGNRYTYAINGPVEYIDPAGISSTTVNFAGMVPSDFNDTGHHTLTPDGLDKIRMPRQRKGIEPAKSRMRTPGRFRAFVTPTATSFVPLPGDTSDEWIFTPNGTKQHSICPKCGHYKGLCLICGADLKSIYPG